jgi:hypothetical protein
MTDAKSEEALVLALGSAVAAVWGRLPHDIQQILFDEVVASSGEPLKQDLAIFLHNKHPRTSEGLAKARQTPEPDSLGG